MAPSSDHSPGVRPENSAALKGAAPAAHADTMLTGAVLAGTDLLRDVAQAGLLDDLRGDLLILKEALESATTELGYLVAKQARPPKPESARALALEMLDRVLMSGIQAGSDILIRHGSEMPWLAFLAKTAEEEMRLSLNGTYRVMYRHRGIEVVNVAQQSEHEVNFALIGRERGSEQLAFTIITARTELGAALAKEQDQRMLDEAHGGNLAHFHSWGSRLARGLGYLVGAPTWMPSAYREPAKPAEAVEVPIAVCHSHADKGTPLSVEQISSAREIAASITKLLIAVRTSVTSRYDSYLEVARVSSAKKPAT